MAVSKSLSLLIFIFLLSGCAGQTAEKEALLLRPAAGGKVMLAATAAPEKISAPSYREWRFYDLSRFTKWQGVLARMETGSPLPPQWQADIPRLKNLSVADRALLVNGFVNAYAYIEEEGDRWSPPHEFFARGGGDCEDFAIAKYALLRGLGVPEKDLRVTIVYDRLHRDMHAVLNVHSSEETLLLDNQIAALRSDEAAVRYRPVFGLGRDAWWLYSEAGAA